jgi:ribonuclease HI
MHTSTHYFDGNSKWHVGTPEVAEAEVTGIREALQWIQNNYGVDTIIEVESDSLHAVQAIDSKHTNKAGASVSK